MATLLSIYGICTQRGYPFWKFLKESLQQDIKTDKPMLFDSVENVTDNWQKAA